MRCRLKGRQMRPEFLKRHDSQLKHKAQRVEALNFLNLEIFS